MEPITEAAVSMGCALERPEHPECWLWEEPGGPSQLPEGPMGSGTTYQRACLHVPLCMRGLED